MSQNYGLTLQDLQNVRNKIKNQESFLLENSFVNSSGEVKNYLDMSFHPNLSKRYYARILNKVDSFVSLGYYHNLVPVFLGVTLDGFFRDALRGDYSRFTEAKRNQYLKHIPNNERNGFYLDHMDKKIALTNKDLYKILSHQMHRFTKGESFRKIKKEGLQYSYIRVTEPHENGVPHFHILLFVPAHYVGEVFKDFYRSFPAPQNLVKITPKNTKKKNKRHGEFITQMTIREKGKLVTKDFYETLGFQTVVRNPAGYVLKYVLKSFNDLNLGNEVDYLQAWYVHNRIPRIITSQTLVSQDVYHKIAPLEKDWYYLSNIKIDGGYFRDVDNDYFVINDGAGRKIIGDNGIYMITNNGRIVASYGSKGATPPPMFRLRAMTFQKDKPVQHNLLKRYRIYLPPKEYSYYIKKSFKEDNSCAWISNPEDAFFIFDTELEYETYIIPKREKGIHKKSDLALINDYYNFDFEIENLVKYAVIHNELVERGLLQVEKVNPNEYNTSFYDV
ncbi:MAG: rolling circle replication-associated protein [Sulfurovum sp.]